MPAPTIGITTYGRNDGGRFDLPAEYVDAIQRAGAVPLLLPPLLPPPLLQSPTLLVRMCAPHALQVIHGRVT